MFLIVLLVFLTYSAWLGTSAAWAGINLEDIPMDGEERLNEHLLVYPEGCTGEIEKSLNRQPSDFRRHMAITGDLLQKISNGTDSEPFKCFAACLEQGTYIAELVNPMPHQVYHGDVSNAHAVSDWFVQNCQAAEVGWVSYMTTPLDVYWINSGTGERHVRAQLQKGERYTFWSQTFLGHKFEIVDSITQEVVFETTVVHNGIYAIGEKPSLREPDRKMDREVSHVLKNEWSRSRRVTRTFTELGFNKGRLPNDLWGSMNAYYYNNRNRKVREEWESKGPFVNWWEVDAFMIQMPWFLKRKWQSRLKQLVEAWSGVELELTDIYGMRRYEDGARLLHHVDREATHALSLIINIAQGGVRSPWTVEIYDFADRLHEVVMEPGDIVYYESAKCLHGRNTPLDADFYVNLFSHYRPIGDPEWFTKSNPEGTPTPLIDIGECTVLSDTISAHEPSVSCGRSDVTTLSPTMNSIAGPGDLYDWWTYTGTRLQNQNKQSSDEL